MACLDEWKSKRFRWGDRDCATFGGSAVEAVLGVTVDHGFRWSNVEGAADVLHRNGSYAGILERYFEDCALGFARDGDLALARSDLPEHYDIPALAVVYGPHLVSFGKKGLEHRPRKLAITAFHVGAV